MNKTKITFSGEYVSKNNERFWVKGSVESIPKNSTPGPLYENDCLLVKFIKTDTVNGAAIPVFESEVIIPFIDGIWSIGAIRRKSYRERKSHFLEWLKDIALNLYAQAKTVD